MSRQVAAAGGGGGGGPTCSYALNGDVSGVGFTPFTMSNGDQTASYTVPSGDSPVYAAAPSGFTGGTSAKINSDADRVVIGLSLALPVTVLNQDLSWTLELRDPGTLGVIHGIRVISSAGTVLVGITDPDGTSSTVVSDVGDVTALFIVADATNSRLRFFYQVGAAVTEIAPLTTFSYTPAQTFAAVRAESYDGVGSLVDTVLSATLLTSAADLAALTGNGFVDNCGTSI